MFSNEAYEFSGRRPNFVIVHIFFFDKKTKATFIDTDVRSFRVYSFSMYFAVFVQKTDVNR